MKSKKMKSSWRANLECLCNCSKQDRKNEFRLFWKLIKAYLIFTVLAVIARQKKVGFIFLHGSVTADLYLKLL